MSERQTTGEFKNYKISGLSEEELRKIAKEEISKSIMDNLDSALIFTYITNLEKENQKLKENSIGKDKIRETKEKVHWLLDKNGITRAYQLEIDRYFEELLKEN